MLCFRLVGQASRHRLLPWQSTTLRRMEWPRRPSFAAAAAVVAEEAVRRRVDGQVALDAIEARLERAQRDGVMRADGAEASLVRVLRHAPHDGAVDDGGAAHAPPLQHGNDRSPRRDLRPRVAEQAEESLAGALAAILVPDLRPLLDEDDVAAGVREDVRGGRSARAAADDHEVARVVAGAAHATSRASVAAARTG
jgi:hypothetical protein